MKALVERVSQPKDEAKYDYDYKKQAYEMGTAYKREDFYLTLVPGFSVEGICESMKMENGQMGSECYFNWPNDDGTFTRMNEAEFFKKAMEMSQGQ